MFEEINRMFVNFLSFIFSLQIIIIALVVGDTMSGSLNSVRMRYVGKEIALPHNKSYVVIYV